MVSKMLEPLLETTGPATLGGAKIVTFGVYQCRLAVPVLRNTESIAENHFKSTSPAAGLAAT